MHRCAAAAAALAAAVGDREHALSGASLDIDNKYGKAYKKGQSYFFVEFYIKLVVEDGSPFKTQTYTPGHHNSSASTARGWSKVCTELDYQSNEWNEPVDSMVNLNCIQVDVDEQWILWQGEASTAFINYDPKGVWLFIHGPDGKMEAGDASIAMYVDEFRLVAYDASELFEGCQADDLFSGNSPIQQLSGDNGYASLPPPVQDIYAVPSDQKCLVGCETEQYLGTEACGWSASCQTNCQANAVYQCDTTVDVNTPPEKPSTGLRVLPLGDSITDGWNFPCGYRGFLKGMLLSNFSDVRFEGSVHTCGMLSDSQSYEGSACSADSCGALNSSDSHEGWPGKQTHQLEDLLHTILPCRWGPNPHVILLCSGTNDFLLGNKKPSLYSGATERLLELVRKVALRRPGAAIVLGTLPPTKNKFDYVNGEIQDFNDGVKTFVIPTALAEGINIILAETGSFDKNTGIQDDGIHPTGLGYEYMAQQFYDAILTLEDLGVLDVHAPQPAPLPAPNPSLALTPPLVDASQAEGPAPAPAPSPAPEIAPSPEISPEPVQGPTSISLSISPPSSPLMPPALSAPSPTPMPGPVPSPVGSPTPTPMPDAAIPGPAPNPVPSPSFLTGPAPIPAASPSLSMQLPPQPVQGSAPFAASPATTGEAAPVPATGGLCTVVGQDVEAPCIVDVDNDDKVSILDAVAVVNEILASKPGEAIDVEYDTNQDSVINVLDVILIVSWITGSI
eukprot:scaffold705_cov402-Prasinococcus_capsulatus_cf.AAC.41